MGKTLPLKPYVFPFRYESFRPHNEQSLKLTPGFTLGNNAFGRRLPVGGRHESVVQMLHIHTLGKGAGLFAEPATIGLSPFSYLGKGRTTTTVPASPADLNLNGSKEKGICGLC